MRNIEDLMQPPASAFEPSDIAIKLFLSLGNGLLVGFEREWSHKDVGVRTFAIISLFGMVAALIAPAFIITALVGVIAVVVVVNAGNIRMQRPLETTTAAALLVTFSLGVLIGKGHTFTPIACVIVMTLLLALKPQFARFAGELTQEEVRSAVLLGLIGFVIYPLLPDRFVDPWRLLNLRQVWLIIILIAGIGFLNYVLLRVYGTRGLYYTAVFGGLVNSSAAIAGLIGPLASAGADARGLGIVVNLLTVLSMFLRNLVLLLIFSPRAGLIAVVPMAAMALGTSVFVLRKKRPAAESIKLDIGSPISLRKLLSFGAIFIVIEITGTLGQRFLGQYGAVLVSAVGGLASSASSTAAIATLSKRGEVQPVMAALATVLASVASMLANLPIVYRETRDRLLIRNLLTRSLIIEALGLIALGIWSILRPA